MSTTDLIVKILTVALAVFAAANIALTLYGKRSQLGFVWNIYKRFRFTMFLEVLGTLTATIAVAVFLIEVLPFTKYGWLNLIIKSGGNILLKPVLGASDSSSVILRFVPVLFLAALLFALPFLAKSEEESFRKGHHEWKEIVGQSMIFGPIHMLVGVPLAAGLALIITGLFYGYKYRRAFLKYRETMSWNEAQDEAVLVSTTYHTMYNSVIVAGLLVGAVIAL